MATPIKDNTTALEELLDRARALPSVPGSVEQATPTITVSSGGLITASATQVAGAVAAGTKSATRQLPTKGATTIEPSDAEQTAVSAGTFVTGDIKVAAQSGGGANIQTKQGNITLSTNSGHMDVNINCEFMPDIVILQFGTFENEYDGERYIDTYQTGVSFIGMDVTKEPMSSSEMRLPHELFSTVDSDALISCRLMLQVSGFSVSFQVYDENDEDMDISRHPITYEAYKLT